MRTLLPRLLAPLLVLACGAVSWAGPKLVAEAGYAKLYSPARPVPVRVHLSLPASEAAFRGALLLEAWQEEGGAPRCIHALEEVELGPGSAKYYLLGFRPDRSKGVRLRLFDGEGEVVSEQVFAYGVELQETPPGVPLVGTLRAKEGRTTLYWPNTYTHRKPQDSSSPAGAVAVEIAPELLAPGGLEGLSALVIGAGQSLEGEQLRALEAWLREGGQVLVAPGSRPLDEDHPLSELLPLLAKSQRRVRGAVAEFETSGGEGSASLITGVMRQGAWVTHAAPDGTPVLVTAGLGRGRVTLLTASLQDPALGSEEVRAGLFERAFALPGISPRGAPRVNVLEQASLRPNLAGAKAAVDRSWIVILVAAFLVVVGPLDYLLWRWRPGPRMTWVTLTVSSLGFSALAFLVGTRGTGPGLEARSTWIVDAFPDGSAVADGVLVVAGRRHSSFSIKGRSGLRFYASGTPDSGEARLQGDLLLGAGEVRFNLGLGACLPLRVRGRVSGLSAPIRVRRLGPDQIEIENASAESIVDVFVITDTGHKWIRVPAERELVSLKSLPQHSRMTLSLVDSEGLMHQSSEGASLWASAARLLVKSGKSGGFSGFAAFDDPVDGVGWGLERSAWLRRGHVVVVAKVRQAPGLLEGRDLPSDLAQRGVTFYRVHVPPQAERLPEPESAAQPGGSAGAKTEVEAKSQSDAKTEDDDAQSDSEAKTHEDAKSDPEDEAKIDEGAKSQSDAKTEDDDAKSDPGDDVKTEADAEREPQDDAKTAEPSKTGDPAKTGEVGLCPAPELRGHQRDAEGRGELS